MLDNDHVISYPGWHQCTCALLTLHTLLTCMLIMSMMRARSFECLESSLTGCSTSFSTFCSGSARGIYLPIWGLVMLTSEPGYYWFNAGNSLASVWPRAWTWTSDGFSSLKPRGIKLSEIGIKIQASIRKCNAKCHLQNMARNLERLPRHHASAVLRNNNNIWSRLLHISMI